MWLQSRLSSPKSEGLKSREPENQRVSKPEGLLKYNISLEVEDTEGDKRELTESRLYLSSI